MEDRRSPVDDDVLDAERVAGGLGVAGLLADGSGIEHDEIGQRTLPHDAAVAQAEPGGWHGGQLRDRGLQ